MLLSSINFKNTAIMPSFQSNPIKHSSNVSMGRLDTVEISKPNNISSSFLDKTAEKLHNAMLEQTYAVDEQAINSIINKVALKTGASKEEIQKTLIKLTQFSSYSQLNALNLAMFEHGISSPRSSAEITDDGKEFSLGSVLTYLQKYKEQFSFASCYPNREGLFLDNMLLDKLESIKDTKVGQEYINTIKEELQNGQTALLVFDGWNAEVDGIDVSHGLFGSRTSLEDSLTLVLNEAKEKNLSVDEVLNNDTIKRARALFGQNAEVEIIRNPNTMSDFSTKNIVKKMAPNMPSKDEIKATIEVLIEKADCCGSQTEKIFAISVLSKYFNHMLTCYSSETLTQELQNKYSEIEEFALQQGKTMDDVYYIIPKTNKSFDLINYQYIKVNNIDPNKVIHCNGSEDYKEALEECDNKIVVLLDDIVGSGNSMISQEFYYHNFVQLCEENYLDINFVFAPLVSLQSGINNLEYAMEDEYRTELDTILVNNTIDYGNFVQSLSEKEKSMLQKLIGNIGFCTGGACTSMPYMIPDNSSEASGYLLSKTLNNSTTFKANKPLDQENGKENWKKFQTSFKEKLQEYKA